MDVFVWCSDKPSMDALEQGIEATLAQDVSSIIVLSCCANHYPEEQVNRLLAEIPFPLCGGIYPQIFHGDKLLEQGLIIVGLPFNIEITAFEQLSEDSSEYSELIEHDQVLKNADSLLIFYDALMSQTEGFIEEFYTVLDHQVTIVGGGAGYLDFIQKPCVYTNDGLKADLIQLVALPKTLNIGIAHGWQILEGPFLVSESQGGTIASLNYKGAFDVYKTTVESLSDYSFEQHDFFDISKHFPFGIESINGELLVRDPIVLNGELILCVGDVPINSMAYILRGERDLLISAVNQAVRQARKNQANDFAIIFDCISRKQYLQDSFQEELTILTATDNAKEAIGALSLGEVINDHHGAIKLHNKSTVIGCL